MREKMCVSFFLRKNLNEKEDIKLLCKCTSVCEKCLSAVFPSLYNSGS